MKHHRNVREEEMETGDPRENLPIGGIVWRDSHEREIRERPPLRIKPGWRETGDPRENPPTGGIVRHDTHSRKSGVNRPGIEPGSPSWEASSLTAQPPWPRDNLAITVKCPAVIVTPV
ncbi:hypothetical protein PR048_031423 [Dryococelus australis]|uniref:Uncharacterized protein n=1 Tax=Dryococelus australis TaxID=614101 RepID=A0ABQ9G581_9NEOP|nr:hypothetical protein PR048_031423 [Dryococelus australis]